MGFAREQADSALEMSDGSLERAAEILMSGALEQPEPQRFMPLILRPERDDSRPEYSFFIFDILGAAGS